MDQDKRESTERTPKGLEVPIPKRREFFDNLKKIAKGKKPRVGEEVQPPDRRKRS